MSDQLNSNIAKILKKRYTCRLTYGSLTSLLRSMHHTQRFPLGSHLMVKHFGYTHHGIYAGRGRVIHYSGFAHLFKKHPIEITSIEQFSNGRPIVIQQHASAKFNGRKVVRRMRSRMHENNYHLIINNCEHLCTWAITGVESSPQVLRMVNRLTTLGYISSMMSFMNSLFLTVTTTSFALVFYIKKKLRDKAKKRLDQYRKLQVQQDAPDLNKLKHH